jgi:hypothetical protein
MAGSVESASPSTLLGDLGDRLAEIKTHIRKAAAFVNAVRRAIEDGAIGNGIHPEKAVNLLLEAEKELDAVTT